MIRRFILGLAIGVGVTVSASVTAAASDAVAADRRQTIVYAGALLGELEPCGCTREGDLGGIRRQATLIDRLREQLPSLILISSGGALGQSLPTFELTNRFILSGLAQLRFDALGVQWGDLAFGVDFISKAGLPLVASNWLSGEFLPSVTVQRPAGQVDLYAWLDPATSPYRAMKGSHQQVGGDPAALGRAIEKRRSAGALTVLVTGLQTGRALPEGIAGMADIVVAPSLQEAFDEPQLSQGTVILRPGSRGQALGILTVSLTAEGRIASWQHEIVPLPDSIPDAPRLASWYTAYSDQLRADYALRAEAGKALIKATLYADERACASCHPRAARAWTRSAHADAFDSLRKVDKTHDANCVGCHVIGFGQPGGFVSAQVSPFLRNVGCQACHGPAKAHLQSGGAAPMTKLAWQAE